ncbi:MAG: DUF2752 domain-containing protein [Thermoguttaceae bacterium]
MANTDETRRTTLSRRDRFWLAAVGLGLLGLLATAAVLRPNPTGHGTHQQLGLPPCTFWTLFHRPCPTCGMTTAWAYLMRGKWLDACRVNAGGALLGVLAMAAAPWLLGSAIRGNWLGAAPSERAAAWGAAIVLLVTMTDWAIRVLVPLFIQP